MEHSNKIAIFQEQEIRRVWHNEQWYFSVLDVVEVLADTPNPTDYFKKMRKRDEQLKTFVGTNCPHVAMQGKEGKSRKTIAANTEGVLRIIQSIPSLKAEPFKQWLAKVGYERIQEIENPELGFERLKEIYRAKGYSEEWIEVRLRSIDIRKQLTDEWQGRGVKEGQEYSILTAEIAKATFGLTPTEHKNLKGLQRENLRDHMTDLELIFTMLGERLTKEVAIDEDAQGFNENSKAAKKGGRAAGDARRAAEKRTGVKVVSDKNYLKQIDEAKQKENKQIEPPSNTKE
ncbi:MAG: Bro-N domain-containing protein [Saprospiraceae bacterium]|nr:Bro-N domain-containing protein [Saprospiraceae bacterium]